LPYGLTAASIDELSDAEVDVEERSVVYEILAGNPGVRGPFSRVGWIQEAKEWLRTEVGRTDAFTGDICQFNASGTFALVRFGTREVPAYWLKATGKPNEREFTITATLSKYFPRFLPPLVATRNDWNAWVTEDAGQPLNECLTFPAIEEAVLALTELQRQSADCINTLIAAGCLDRRIPVLQSELNNLFSYLEEAMGQQTTTKVPRLEPHQLRELCRISHDACSEMQDLGLPDTLAHLDINPGNVLFDGSRCVFIDWAEACIGNPLLTFEQLRTHVERSGEPASSSVSHLRAIYARSWLDRISESNIDRAFALAPLLAIATYLYGRGDWLDTPRRTAPALHSYARSLARHMYRAAQGAGLTEASSH